MIGEAKYIIFRDYPDEYPVIFPLHIKHDSITAPGRPVSAGFVSADLKPSGYSIGLDLECRAEDEGIIKAMFDLGGE